MLDGSVVLCCDDAYAYEKYGNVFEDSIEKFGIPLFMKNTN